MEFERESVRLHAYSNLKSLPFDTWCKHRDGIFASIGREDESARFGYERACHCREARNRFNISISRGVDHVDCIVAGMCDIKPICSLMDISMIEPTLGSIWWKLDMTE